MFKDWQEMEKSLSGDLRSLRAARQGRPATASVRNQGSAAQYSTAHHTTCHCEKRSDEAIPVVQAHELSVRLPAGDCFVASLLAMIWGGPAASWSHLPPSLDDVRGRRDRFTH